MGWKLLVTVENRYLLWNDLDTQRWKRKTQYSIIVLVLFIHIYNYRPHFFLLIFFTNWIPYFFITPTDTTSADLYLFDSHEDGWSSAYYNVYSSQGVLLTGGSLLDSDSGIHELCLPNDSCSIVMIQIPGKYFNYFIYFIYSFSLFILV